MVTLVRRYHDLNKVFIIAEAGVNHNGNIIIAKKLVDAAAEAGVDAIKFQTFITENLVSKDARKAYYQQNNTPNQETQFEMLKKLELSKNMHLELIEYCDKKRIMFLSTGFDLESIAFLDEINLPLFKIPSGEITNLPYLRKIGASEKAVILSTGMSTLKEVEDALRVLRQMGAKDVTVLHCNTEYPTPMKDVNLSAMLTLKKAFNVPVGYSDHTQGIEVAIAAVALGATVIEKHFTLDKNMKGPDHKASLEPKELQEMVKAIRNIELAMGDGVKQVSPSEEKNKQIARKSIVAKTNIVKGQSFTEENITAKRSGNGISPMKWDEVIDQIATKDYEEDELIVL